MRHIYVIKHFWDEKSYGATIEPKWLFSKQNLTQEELKVRQIIEEYTKLSKYNELATKKPPFERKNDLYIYFCYKDKDDPDPTNNRKVTDITFIISPKILKNPCKLANYNNYVYPIKNYKKLLISLAIVCIGFFSILVLFKVKNNEKTQNVANIKKDERINVKSTNAEQKKKTIDSKQQKIHLICKKYSKIVKNPQYCYERYFSDICKKNINESYNVWLSKNKECKILVGNLKDDKQLKNAPIELKKFIKSFIK